MAIVIAEDQDLGLEWRVLELLCRGAGSGPDRDAAVELLGAERLDTARLLEQAARHRLIPLLAEVVADDGVCPRLAPQVRGELLGQLLANRRRVDRLAEVAAEVTGALQAAGVRVAATKGVVLQATVYGDAGTRKMLDADVMVAPDSRAAVPAVLAELGYRQGEYDWRRHRIADLPAARRSIYRLSPDHLPHFMKLEPHRAGVVVVDVANSVTWHASEWQVPMADVLSGIVAVPLSGGALTVPGLSPEWHFLFTVLHLFRESWFLRTVAAGKDMLYKFGDVLGIWRQDRPRLVAAVPGILAEHHLQQPVCWVLEHTDRLFGSTLTAELGLAGVATEEWLAGGEAPGGRPVRWSGSMRERLFAVDRTVLFRDAA